MGGTKENIARSVETGKISKRIMPLVSRGGEVGEILNIVQGLDREKVIYIINSARESAFNSVDYIDRIRIDRGNGNHDVSAQTSSDRQKIAFARGLFENDLIPPQNACFSEVIEFCKRNKLETPNNFYDMLRLEMYYGAVVLASMGDKRRLDKYNDIGNKVDSEWFVQSLATKEENSIRDTLYQNRRKGDLLYVTESKIVYGTSNPNCEAVSRLKRRWGIIDPVPPVEPTETTKPKGSIIKKPTIKRK